MAGSCSFEDNHLCGFSNDLDNDFDWIYGSNDDHPNNLPIDHSTNFNAGEDLNE